MAPSRSRAVLVAALAALVAAGVPALAGTPGHAPAHPRASHHKTSHHKTARHRATHHRAARRSARRPRPAAVALRLGQVNREDVLFAPGLAMASAQQYLTPGVPVTLPSEPLRRPVTLVGRPLLRLHVAHTMPGDLSLAVGLDAVAPSGSARAVLAPVVSRIPAAVLNRGPAADADLALPAVRVRLAPGERLQLTLNEPLTSGSGDWVTLYFGALPGEDPDPNNLQQQNDAAQGGHDPARLVLQAYGFGPFQSW